MTVQVTPRRVHQRILEVAREYRQNGYDVIIEPKEEQLPAFLTQFNLTMLARNNDENVIIEIRTQESLTQSPELDALATALNNHDSWRLELVVTNPKDRTAAQFRNLDTLTQQDISYRLVEARELSDREHGEAAFLLAWSATEAMLRAIVEQEAIPVTPNQPIQLVKALFVYGLLDNRQYMVLNEAQQLRNVIAHGYQENQVLRDLLHTLLSIIEELAHQYMPSSRLPNN